MTVSTKTNTTFANWWKKLNKLLVKGGLAEAGFRTAHDFYEMGDSPETAADYLINM